MSGRRAAIKEVAGPRMAMPIGYIHGTGAAEQERLARLNRLTNPPFLEFLACRPCERALEVGSGLGILAAQAAARLAPGFLAGVEVAWDQLAAAARQAGPGLHFCRADGHSLPFASSAFDLVYGRYVLEHVGDPVRLLREMRRVLRAGGRACVQENDNFALKFDPPCPRFDRVWRRFAALQRRLGGDPLIGKKLFRLFRQAGFNRVELSLQPQMHAAGTPDFRPWVENFIALARPVRRALAEAGLASGAEVDAGCAELERLLNRDDATAIFYWNRARGWK